MSSSSSTRSIIIGTMVACLVTTVAALAVVFLLRGIMAGWLFFVLLLSIPAVCIFLSGLYLGNALKGSLLHPLRDITEGLNQNDSKRIEQYDVRQAGAPEVIALSFALKESRLRFAEERQTMESTKEALFDIAGADALTGLSNRMSGIRQLNYILSKARAEQQIVTVFDMDIDRFKLLNDSFGHAVGDEYIVALATRFKEQLSDNILLARLGGDEFMIVAQGLERNIEKQFYAEKIFDIMRRPVSIKERDIVCTASVGSSSFPQDGCDADTLLGNAELGMEKAKAMGEGLYISYQKSFSDELQHKIFIENKLRKAVQDNCNEFRAVFQPKVHTETGKVVGCEALMRWAAPDGMVMPGEFIPQAEESGLIVPMTWWMLGECCRCAREFEERGIEGTVAINISTHALLHEDFLQAVQNAVEESGIGFNRLDIEITESTLAEDVQQVNIILNALHDMGTEISVDDFGTGYSSLSYLNRLAVDRIKIDRSFISGVNTNEEDRAIVQAVVAMAQNLGMMITAEGVEDEQQYAYLRGLRCDETQGYYISRPIPKEDYITFYSNWKESPPNQ